MPYSLTSSKVSDIINTGRKMFGAKVSPDAATGDVTIPGMTSIDYAIISFCEDLTATCYTCQVIPDTTTLNKINIKLWKAGGTAADTGYLDVMVIGVGT